MLFRPSRVVKVTTPEELDSAFASADRLIVEGDDALLSYAATKAAGGTGNEVKVQLAADAPAPRRGKGLPVVIIVVLVAIVLIAAGIYFFVPFPEAAAPTVPHYHHKLETLRGGHEQPIEVGVEGPSEWAPFLWPAVSIIAITALFFIARQAIAGGRNVEISWKVTEKVSGRVVITKVRTPVRRQRAVAA
jgi:hypothetical protein